MIKSLKLILFSLIAIFAVIYLLVVGYLYFNQENIIFQPETLSADYKFTFQDEFEEVYNPVEENVKLHGLLFKAQKSKGLVFYLHGNAGSVAGWGGMAQTYTSLGYDLFILDYRGYGKSNGNIKSEGQFLSDVKSAYAYFQKSYKEENIIIAGYSIGTGPATILAAANHPKALVLQAPYYSLTKIIDSRVPFMPHFLQKFRFETYKYLKKVKSPVYIFHGTDDSIIPFDHSGQLKKYLKLGDVLTVLPGQEHNGINENTEYKAGLRKLFKD